MLLKNNQRCLQDNPCSTADVSTVETTRQRQAKVTSHEAYSDTSPIPFLLPSERRARSPDKQIRHRTRYFRRMLPLPVVGYKGTSNVPPNAADTTTFTIELGHQRGGENHRIALHQPCSISCPSVSFQLCC
ncbi:hypothetical protein AVEN_111637-1 [Araneus ventricosus]|uniref:Uncharacterized protein n=1 Tax=Araneus ventricosus TaxID=182803 RepID=A0A4Y2C2G5_ARAVE|nr:hypothetical protein AVEN_111637-1 [Araneus ventricosus]